ncbi:MAG TPA: MMPL family transporter [Verrucomicrobiae bacterium]|nr:MMPL family transporter [Verrucomicrobiae bacterium]
MTRADAPSRYETVVVAYARWVVRNRWLAVGLSLLAVGAMVAGVTRLKFDTDFRAYFGSDNPQLQAFDEQQKVYNKSDSFMLAFVPREGSGHADVFNPSVLAAVRDFTREAWQIPYTIRVDSVTNFQWTQADGDDLKVEALLPDGAEFTPEVLARTEQRAMGEPALLNRLVNRSGGMTLVNVNSQFPQASNNELPAAVESVRALREAYEQKYPDVEILLTGSNMLSNAFTEAARKDMVTLIPAMYAVIFLIMWLLLRSAYAVLATLLVVFLSSLAAMGLAGYFGIGLTPPVLQAPQIITVLAVADSVHICLTMFALMRGGRSKHDAIIESMRVNFTPVFLVSATTSICFLGTNFTDSPPLTALGNITSIGGMLSWLLAIFLLPALLAILPARVPKERKAEVLKTLMDRHADFVLRNKAGVAAFMVALILGLTALAPLNEANDKFLHYFDQRVPFRDETDRVVAERIGFYSIEWSLKSGESNGIADPGFLRQVQAFADWWSTQPKVVYVGNFGDVFKRLNQSMHGDDPSWYRLPDDRDLAAQYLLLYEMSLPFGLDLNNQVNIDKSSVRFIVTFQNMSSRETREAEARARQWLHENAPNLETHGTGPPVMFSHIAKRNIESNFLSLPLCMAGISLLLLPGLRSWRFGLLTLVPNLVPLGMAFGIWALVSGQIIFTMAVVVNMVVGIIVDDTIHFLSKYLRAKRELGLAPEPAVRYAFHEAGSAMLVTTAILASGFAILSMSAFLPNATMSLLTTIAIVVALPVDLLLLPLLVLWIDREKKPDTEPMESADEAFPAK